MNTDDFEKRLQRQPPRQLPPAWRGEILRNAERARASTPDPRPSFLSALLWPNPKAWAALAAVWIAILALHFSSSHDTIQMAKKPSMPASEMIAGFRDQRRVLAELIGTTEPRDVEVPKRFSPQPHSERRTATAMA